jgi:hypothetical protein
VVGWENRTPHHQTRESTQSFHGDTGGRLLCRCIHLILDPFPRILRSPIPTEAAPINYASQYDTHPRLIRRRRRRWLKYTRAKLFKLYKLFANDGENSIEPEVESLVALDGGQLLVLIKNGRKFLNFHAIGLFGGKSG